MFRFCVPRIFVALLMWCTAGSAYADVVELPVSADRCAIYHALTGAVAAGCAPPDDAALGTVRSLPKNVNFPREAAPLLSMEEERGYFVRFAFDSDVLTKTYNDHLSRLSQVLSSEALAESCLKLVGHTDSVGGATYNMKLAEARAIQVAAFLAAKGGISPNRIVTEARGEGALLPNLPGAHPRNRRVEVLAKAPANGKCS